jgi:hypothetical protein
MVEPALKMQGIFLACHDIQEVHRTRCAVGELDGIIGSSGVTVAKFGVRRSA